MIINQSFICVTIYITMLYMNYINRNYYIDAFEYDNVVSPFQFMISLLKKIIFPSIGLIVVDQTLSVPQTICTLIVMSLFGVWTHLLPEKTADTAVFYLLCEVCIFTVISLLGLVAWSEASSVLQTLVYGFICGWSTMMMLMFVITLIRDGYKKTRTCDNIVPMFFIIGIIIFFTSLRWHNGWTIALPLLWVLLKSWKSYNTLPLLDWDIDRLWTNLI